MIYRQSPDAFESKQFSCTECVAACTQEYYGRMRVCSVSSVRNRILLHVGTDVASKLGGAGPCDARKLRAVGERGHECLSRRSAARVVMFASARMFNGTMLAACSTQPDLRILLGCRDEECAGDKQTPDHLL